MIRIVKEAEYSRHGIVAIDARDRVWLTFKRPWWDIKSWLRWWLTSGLRVWLQLQTKDKQRIRIRAVCISKSFIKID